VCALNQRQTGNATAFTLSVNRHHKRLY